MRKVGIQECVDEVPVFSCADTRLIAGAFPESVVAINKEIEQGVSHKRLESASTYASGAF